MGKKIRVKFSSGIGQKFQFPTNPAPNPIAIATNQIPAIALKIFLFRDFESNGSLIAKNRSNAIKIKCPNKFAQFADSNPTKNWQIAVAWIFNGTMIKKINEETNKFIITLDKIMFAGICRNDFANPITKSGKNIPIKMIECTNEFAIILYIITRNWFYASPFV